MSKFVCDACFKNFVEIGEIVDGHWLAKIGKKYVVLGNQGHRGDEVYTFPCKPSPEPRKTSEFFEWDKNVEEHDKKAMLNFGVAFELVASAVKSGYDQDKHGHFFRWFWNRAARMIRKHERKK
jgi:hypothetical protein